MKDKRPTCIRMLNSRRLSLTVLVTAFLCSPVYLISRPDGFSIELRRTGGNYPGETTCTDALCHVGSPNTGSGSISVSANGMPINQYAYTPGETVPIVVTIAQQGRQRWGFQATTRTQSSNGCVKAGEIAVSPNDQQVTVRADPSRPGACPSEGDVRPQFAMHQFAKSGPNMATYEFNWTAPSSNIGPVLFAAAGNAANGDNTQNGDSIYTIRATIEPANIQPAPKPIVGQGGIVLSTLSPLVSSISANSIISIFGQNFAPEGTAREPGAGDLVNGRVPTQLAGTCVEVGSRRAPIFFVSPLQMNVQAPSIDALGQVAVQVIRDCGLPSEQRSDVQTATAESVTPAFFIRGASPDGMNPIAALDLDFNLVGQPSANPAAPGEIISLFATGFGATNPSFEAGQIPQVVNPANPIASVTANTTVSIGGIELPPEDVFYVGVAPCCAGLYQLVVRVPASLNTGNHQVIVTVGGVATPAGPFIAVERPQ